MIGCQVCLLDSGEVRNESKKENEKKSESMDFRMIVMELSRSRSLYAFESSQISMLRRTARREIVFRLCLKQ